MRKLVLYILLLGCFNVPAQTGNSRTAPVIKPMHNKPVPVKKDTLLPLPEKNITIDTDHPFVDAYTHLNDCQVYQKLRKWGKTTYYIVQSFQYDAHGRVTEEVMGNYENPGQNEYHTDLSTINGRYKEYHYYDQNGKLIGDERFFPNGSLERVFYHYDVFLLLASKEVWYNSREPRNWKKTGISELKTPLPDSCFVTTSPWKKQSSENYFYNSKGQLTGKKYYFPSFDTIPYEVYTYTYDANGRIKTEKMEGQILHWNKEWNYFSWGYEIRNDYLGNSKTVFRLDKHSRLKETWWENLEKKDGTSSDHQKFYYDKRGRLKKETVTVPGKLRPYLVHTYRYKKPGA